MPKPRWILVPLALLTLVGCQAPAAEPVPTVTQTVTETVTEAAPLPAECAQAFTAGEDIGRQASELADDWQVYATGPMVQLLQGTITEEAVVAAHQTMVDKQTAFAEDVKSSQYAALKAACLNG